MKQFNHEEIALMSCYDTTSLANLIGSMQEALPQLENKLDADTTADCIDALCGMDEQDFARLLPELAMPEMF